MTPVCSRLTFPAWLVLLGLAYALALPSTVRAQARFDLSSTPTLLPKSVLPTGVDLRLDLDPARQDFGGRVRIEIDVREDVDAVLLHAVDLQAQSAALVQGRQDRRLRVNADTAAGTWRLVPVDGRPIPVGAYRLDIAYRGRIRTTGEGLFRVDFRTRDRPDRMLVTQLEAVHARAVFPAFDEPVFRVPFTLGVRAPAGYEVVSNMPERAGAKAVQAGKATLHQFATTPSMPTYLLALAVGHFDVLSGTVDDVPLRILTPRGKREQARIAMQMTRQVLPYYAAYFGRPYALPKLDQLAVPGTMQGAMENWGLITYNEGVLLLDPARSGPDTERRVFQTVAHEIAHQWFGNLVSVASWNEIWLNEAFATWMTDKAMDHFHPEWNTPLRTRATLDAWVLARDSTSATRAIRSGPVSEASVFEVFDGITYGKGGAVLSMLEQWIGTATFQRGLAAYMAERGMRPATAGDLWHHIGQAADEPVAEVAASWTDQPGVPLLRIAANCENGVTVLQLRQNRFSLGEPLPGGPWLLPVRLARGEDALSVLMRDAEQRVELPDCDARPLRVNAGGQGYYRVEYDPATRRRLVADFAGLPATDQVALLSDSFALASAGRQPMADHFALLRELPRVASSGRSALFAQALSQFGVLDLALDGTPAQAPLQAAGQALFAPALARLGWSPAPGEDSETRQLRGDLISRLARLVHAPTVAAARQRFDAALKADASVSPSIRRAVLVAVGAQATDKEFDALLQALRATDSEEERWTLVSALAAGRDAGRARRLLAEALGSRLPPSVSADLPGRVGRQAPLVSIAYDFVLAHWEPLGRLAGDGVFGGRNWLLPDAVAGSSDPGAARRLLDDQQRLLGEPGRSAAAQAAAAIEARRQLREREGSALASALDGWTPAR